MEFYRKIALVEAMDMS